MTHTAACLQVGTSALDAGQPLAGYRIVNPQARAPGAAPARCRREASSTTCLPLRVHDTYCFMLTGGDISLGCWTATGREKSCKPAGKGPRGSPCKKPQASTPQSPSRAAQHAPEPAGSSDMDLTSYFATLPNEMVPFKDLISPLPVSS